MPESLANSDPTHWRFEFVAIRITAISVAISYPCSTYLEAIRKAAERTVTEISEVLDPNFSPNFAPNFPRIFHPIRFPNKGKSLQS